MRSKLSSVFGTSMQLWLRDPMRNAWAAWNYRKPKSQFRGVLDHVQISLIGLGPSLNPPEGGWVGGGA